MAVWVDQTGRRLELSGPPRRIVSTVPSQTELLYDLGLEAEVVGITAYCEQPPHWLGEKTVIGGTKDLQLDKIRALEPDLIIGNKEENIKEQIEALAAETPVWLSDVRSVDHALEMIAALGGLTGRREQAEKLYQRVTTERQKIKPLSGLRAAFLIWKNPLMMAGPDTFIGQVMQEAGWSNAAPEEGGRYPQTDLPALQSMNLDVLLLSSEPYAFTSADLHQLSAAARHSRVVDAQLFSWYGSRMQHLFPYLGRLQEQLQLIFSR